MSEEEKMEQMRQEKRAFIKEQTAPNKKNQLKKKTDKILFVILAAIIFGFVSSLVFVFSSNLFRHYIRGEQKVERDEPNARPSPAPSVEPTATPVPKASKNPKDDFQIAGKNGSLRFRDIARISRLMEEYVTKQKHSMVTVSALQRAKDWFDNPTVASKSTYGVVLEKENGKIRVLTEAKVLSMGENLVISIDEETQLSAKILSSSKSVDFAVLEARIDKLEKKSAEQIQPVKFYAGNGPGITTDILFLGKANGWIGSAVWGRVTTDAVRLDVTDRRIAMYLTDIPENAGAKGVVLNLDGELVGILSSDFQEELQNTQAAFMGIKELRSDIERLLDGKPLRYMGIKGQDMTEETVSELKAEEGVYVTEVEADSPAYKAGMRNGDVIMAIDEEKITSLYSLNEVLQGDKIESAVTVNIFRTAGKQTGERKIKLNLGKMK